MVGEGRMAAGDGMTLGVADAAGPTVEAVESTRRLATELATGEGSAASLRGRSEISLIFANAIPAAAIAATMTIGNWLLNLLRNRSWNPGNALSFSVGASSPSPPAGPALGPADACA